MNGITPSLNYRQKLCELLGKSAEELGLLSTDLLKLDTAIRELRKFSLIRGDQR